MGAPRSRFIDFINQRQVKNNSPITVIGVGGIGSRISETLAQIGFDLSLWDPQCVGAENIGSQNYGYPDVGKVKVNILKERFETRYGVRVQAYRKKFAGQIELSGIVICGVDSKEARAEIWESIKYNPLVHLYLDGRVGGERYKLFCVSPCDPEMIRKYETQLDVSKPAMEAPCTAKFSPQAGIALDLYMWVAIRDFIRGNSPPFLIAGENFDNRLVG